MKTYPKLPKAFKNKWIKALRSGEYKQGENQLHNQFDNTYCCLGVACRIMHPRKELNSGVISSALSNLKGVKVPEILKGEFDSTYDDYNPLVEKLVNMNDGGKSFKVIANWIEKNL